MRKANRNEMSIFVHTYYMYQVWEKKLALHVLQVKPNFVCYNERINKWSR